MWRRKKFIVIALLATILVVGGATGVVLAADNGDEDVSPPKAPHGAILEGVCKIYNANPDTSCDIDCEALEAAFAQARSEMRAECTPNRVKPDPEAMKNRIQTLYDEGKITEAQYSKIMERLQSWADGSERPFFGRMRGMHRFGGPCAPTE